MRCGCKSLVPTLNTGQTASPILADRSLKMEDVEILETCIQDLDDGIESLSKSLIKYRVSVLNI
ncbi:hypothetical protein YC2023_095343 [Brassica napus]